MLQYFDSQRLRRRLDAVFSIDAMVHVDLQYLIVYLVSAALRLKRGGLLMLTLADPTTAGGFQKLLEDIRLYYARQGRSTAKFEWVSREMITALLSEVGFRVVRCDAPAPEGSVPRDLFLVACLEDVDVADRYERYIRP